MQIDIFNPTAKMRKGSYKPKYCYENFKTADGWKYPKVLVAGISNYRYWCENGEYECDLYFAYTIPKDPNQKICSVYEFLTGLLIGSYPIGTSPKRILNDFLDIIPQDFWETTENDTNDPIWLELNPTDAD